MDWETVVTTAVCAVMSVHAKDSQRTLGNRSNRHKQQGVYWECSKERHFARDYCTKEEVKPQKTSSGNKTCVTVTKNKKTKVT